MGDANLYGMFAKAGPKPFLVEGDRVLLRYDEIEGAAARIGHRLRSAGAVPGDRVVAQVEKSPEAVLLYLACLRAGLVFVPLNTGYTSSEVAYFLGDAEPAVLVCDGGRKDALAEVAGPRLAILTLDADGGGSLMNFLGTEMGAAEPRLAEDLASILYTSGTTGRSKGAMLSHGNLAANARTLCDIWQWRGDDVLLHALPIYHIHGLFVALHCALLGGSTVLFHRKFDAAAVVQDLPCASVFMGVPTHYARLLEQSSLDADDFKNMRLFVSGSAPLLEDIFAKFATRTGHKILERYGMTETGMIASNPYEGARVPRTVGYALPGESVRVAGGNIGVLEVKGPNVFQGYWRMPKKTAEEFTEDGYFITGDVGMMADDGRISIVGRAKDLIISGGLNIYPKDIELLIDLMPGVTESAVIGVPHADFGEAVVAVVVGDSSEGEVMAGLDGQLARFKQPKRVVFVRELPRNAMGKVQKVALRETYKTLFLT